ncbi:Uncharacterised protein r2_g3519 [Pycnogonum litorale]
MKTQSHLCCHMSQQTAFTTFPKLEQEYIASKPESTCNGNLVTLLLKAMKKLIAMLAVESGPVNKDIPSSFKLKRNVHPKTMDRKMEILNEREYFIMQPLPNKCRYKNQERQHQTYGGRNIWQQSNY